MNFFLFLFLSLSPLFAEDLQSKRSCAEFFIDHPNDDALFETAASKVIDVEVDIETRMDIFYSQANLRSPNQTEIELLTPISRLPDQETGEYRQDDFAYRLPLRPSVSSQYVELLKKGFSGAGEEKNPVFILVHADEGEMVFFLEDWFPFGSRSFSFQRVNRVGPPRFEKALAESLYYREEITVNDEKVVFSGPYRMNTNRFETGMSPEYLSRTTIVSRNSSLPDVSSYGYWEAGVDPYLRRLLKNADRNRISTYHQSLRGLGFVFRQSNQGQGAIIVVPRPELLHQKLKALGQEFSHISFIEDNHFSFESDPERMVDEEQILKFAQHLAQGEVTIFNHSNRFESYLKTILAFTIMPPHVFHWLTHTYRALLQLHSSSQDGHKFIEILRSINRYTFSLMNHYLRRTLNPRSAKNIPFDPSLIVLTERVKPEEIGNFDSVEFYQDISTRIKDSSNHTSSTSFTPANLNQILDQGQFPKKELEAIAIFNQEVQGRLDSVVDIGDNEN